MHGSVGRLKSIRLERKLPKEESVWSFPEQEN